MFFSLESAQSPALCATPGTKTSTVGLNLPFSKISPSSFERNKAFSDLVAKMFQEGESQDIKSPQLLSHCNLESISHGTVLYNLLFREFLKGISESRDECSCHFSANLQSW